MWSSYKQHMDNKSNPNRADGITMKKKKRFKYSQVQDSFQATLDITIPTCKTNLTNNRI